MEKSRCQGRLNQTNFKGSGYTSPFTSQGTPTDAPTADTNLSDSVVIPNTTSEKGPPCARWEDGMKDNEKLKNRPANGGRKVIRQPKTTKLFDSAEEAVASKPPPE